MANNGLDLWVEKWRPDTLNGYVFKNEKMKLQIEEWIENPQKKKIPVPHLLLSGNPGVGKTTLAYILCNVLKIANGDRLYINASRENNVDTVREKIIGFCSTWPMGDYKIIILDEADSLSMAAQKILRSEIEKFTDSVRFFITCNYPSRIIPALHSRFQGYHIDTLDMQTFLERLSDILDQEKIDYQVEDVVAFVNSAYPDMRKAINLLEQHVRGGKLYSLEESQTSKDYLIEMASLFKSGNIKQAREMICSQVRPEEYDDVYRYFYKNLDLFSNTEEGQEAAIILIARGLRDHAVIGDPEINLASVMVQLAHVND